MTPSTKAASTRRLMDADGKRRVGTGSPVDGLLLGGFDQHSTQCGRRWQNLRDFHYARTIAIKDGIGQVSGAKNRNCGGTRELDHLGGLLRGPLRISVRVLLLGRLRNLPRCLPSFGGAWRRDCGGFFFCLEREVFSARVAPGATAADAGGSVAARRDQLSGASKGRSSEG